MIGGLVSEALPSVDLAQGDLGGSEQRPEQHGGGFGVGQHGLGLDPALELLVQALDCVRGSYRLPLARREAGESEEFVAGLLQAVAARAAFEAPFADEGLAPGLDLVPRRA